MAKIFLSYRRQDSAAMAGRIYDRLRAHFGNDAVFMDIDDIPFGVNFRKHIDAAVSQCDVVLAVIGTKWAGETDVRRRLDDSRDFVRIELESALHRDLPVIPILIDRASMPGEADLPTSLALLADYNAIDVDQGRDFHHHVDLLIKGIELHLQRANVPAAGPSSPAPEAASTRPVLQEPERPRNVTPTEAGERPGPAPTAEARPDSLPSTSDPGQQPKAKPQGADGLKPKTRAMPAGVIESEPLPIQTPAALGQRVSSVSSHLEGAPPKRRNVPRHRFYLAALPLLAFLAVIIYVVTNQRGQETPREFPKPSPTELAGNKQAASAPPSAAGESKPASSRTHVQSFKPPPPQPKREWTNSIGIKLVRIEAGAFLMGSTKDQIDQLARQFPRTPGLFVDEKPQHSVTITRPFFLSMYELTQGQYQAVMGQNPSEFKGSDDLPVEQVSWLDAVTYCNKLSDREGRKPYYRIKGDEVTIDRGNGYRLPTEAEWEYACRAGSLTLYPSGDDASALDAYAWYRDNSGERAHPVGHKRPNAWGLYDMVGNVWEWCADGYDKKYYATSPSTDPPGPPAASRRVIRGCGWLYFPWHCRPAARHSRKPEGRESCVGFRVAAVQE